MSVLWALARHTLITALRQRAALALIVLFVMLTIGLPYLLKSVDNQANQVRILLTYNLTIATGLLSILTILLSASTLDKEIVQQQIFLIASKPVRHWQLLFGKWLGLSLLNAWLLVITGSLTVILAYLFARPDPQKPGQYAAVREQVLTSRVSVRPPEIDVEEAIGRFADQLRKKGATEEDLKARGIRAQLKRHIEKNVVRIPPFGQWRFQLSGLPYQDDKQSQYTLRHKLYCTDTNNAVVRGEWRLFRPDRSTGTFVWRTETKSGNVREFQVPSWVVDPQGRTVVLFRNYTLGNPRALDSSSRKSHTISFSTEEGLEILAPRGVFLLNFAKALLLLWIRLATFALIGISATSLLHLPVTLLLFCMVLAFGYGSGFINSYAQNQSRKTIASSKVKEFAPGQVGEAFAQRTIHLLSKIMVYPMRATAALVPDMQLSDPEPHLKAGRDIPELQIFQCFAFDLLLRGGLAALLGLALLRRREFALPDL